MLEDTAPERLSSPHTNAFVASALNVGISFWANVRSVNARTTTNTSSVRRIVVRTGQCRTARCSDVALAGQGAMPHLVNNSGKVRDWQKYQHLWIGHSTRLIATQLNSRASGSRLTACRGAWG